MSEKDLALGVLRSHFKEKLEGYDYFLINQLQIRDKSVQHMYLPVTQADSKESAR